MQKIRWIRRKISTYCTTSWFLTNRFKRWRDEAKIYCQACRSYLTRRIYIYTLIFSSGGGGLAKSIPKCLTAWQFSIYWPLHLIKLFLLIRLKNYFDIFVYLVRKNIFFYLDEAAPELVSAQTLIVWCFGFGETACSFQAHLAPENSIFGKLIKFVFFGTFHAKFSVVYCGKVTSKHWWRILQFWSGKLFYCLNKSRCCTYDLLCTIQLDLMVKMYKKLRK